MIGPNNTQFVYHVYHDNTWIATICWNETAFPNKDQLRFKAIEELTRKNCAPGYYRLSNPWINLDFKFYGADRSNENK